LHYKLSLVVLLTTLWGLRLTFNFARRGGYGNFFEHEEDYRWPILRKQIASPVLFFLFNVTFIAGYQNLLLMLIALPAYYVPKAFPDPRSLETTDLVLTATFLALLAAETIADQQQWTFQNKKYAIPAASRASHPSSVSNY
jgi:steroid 5-alpha reductase family enzyme